MTKISDRPLGAERDTGAYLFVKAEQDGLFFGSAFARDFLQNGPQGPEPVFYLRDGDCVLKGQTVFCFPSSCRGKTETLLKTVGGLSGACTLTACFVERDFDFSIMAGPLPGLAFSEEEKKAILKAGALIQERPNSLCDMGSALKAVEKGERRIFLDGGKFSKKADMEKFFRELPPSVEVGLCGPFMPSDLGMFSGFDKLKFVWPDSLRGDFPPLAMKIGQSA